MSASLARLRKRAAELEQKKQFDRALEVYVQILDEGGKDLDDEDVPLFNRVGDMLMRKGSVTEALGYYERAVDVYAERGYLNNAIALCSKILRQSPGRAAVYYKLARISARKGFKSDARKNFLEYADRMQKLGMADEAFRALKEFASLYPDQDDVRLVLAELLSKENRKGEALEQLQSLYEKLQSEGRSAEARATIDRMRAIDPRVTPREGTTVQSPAAGDLVFLDLTDTESTPTPPRPGHTAQPTSARAPIPSPVPALDGLSITFLPEDNEAPHPDGFESTAVDSESIHVPPVERSLTPLGMELVVSPSAPDDPVDVPPIELLPDRDHEEPATTRGDDDPASLERVEDMIDDLLPESDPAPPHPAPRSATPLSSYQFADVELDEAPRESPHREHDLFLPGALPLAAADTPATPLPALDSVAAADDARAAAEEAADLAADVAAREAAQARAPAELRPATLLFPPRPDESVAGTDLARAETNADAPEADVEIPDDFMALPPSFGSSSSNPAEYVFPPLPGLEDASPLPDLKDAPQLPDEESQTESEREFGAEPPTSSVQGTVSIGGPESHLRSRLEIEPENWDLRRQLGEVLLDAGDRDAGLYELELAMSGYELKGDLSRAQEVVDEILRVTPGSVSHHQKRVEYAVKSRDRQRLTDSYLELADALFRNGSADKAVAVYSRVLEHDASNERAEFALATLAPDKLEKLRGVPARPGRWSDELATIHGNTPPSQSAHPAQDNAVLPDESSAEVSEPSHQDRSSKSSPRVRFDSIELPVPDWGEGVPRTKQVGASPPATQVEASEGTPADTTFWPPAAENAPQPEQVDAVSEERDDRESTAEGVTASDESEDHSPPSVPRDTTPPGNPEITDDAVAPDSETSKSGASMRPTVSRPTPISISSSGNGRPRTPQHASTPRGVTPVPVPAITSDSPLAEAESDFIDLGEWLRNTEPPRSTRMQVEDPKPTGDEQADFEEMLRRFKRGVAANVEAEDYDAHYDLGVAYKEMGLVDEAIAQFQKALRGVQHRVRSYEALGQCFVEKQQFAIAAALLQRATEVPGSDDQLLVGVLYLLGFAREQMGHPEEALPYYLRVFAVDIEFRDVAERVAALGNATK